jgi:hypothetical protein
VAISSKTRKLLWSRSHNRCAFPRCRVLLTDDARDAVTGETLQHVAGEEAHIRAQSAGGPRFDASYPKAQIDSYENLILLCPQHHAAIDDNNGRAADVKSLLKMKREHERGEEQTKRITTVITAYIADQYQADDQVLFEQVELNGPRVDAMFVDVPFSTVTGTPIAAVLAHLAEEHPGDTELSTGTIVTGAAQALLHPEWSGNALIVGGPGQGKSTLLQYVCQFHRARHLGHDEYNGEAQRLQPVTQTQRVPIRIDLRDYSQWASTRASKTRQGRKQQASRSSRPGVEWPSIEQYLAERIAHRSGGQRFGTDDLARLVVTSPVLLALDGLDEVSNIAHREQVGQEITSTGARLKASARDLVIIVATRPGSMETPLWSSSQFPQFRLQRLTTGLRLQYLQKWAAVAGLSDEAQANLQATLLKHEDLPHIRDLAAYPMQLAILLHLLHRSGYFPTQRTELYREYLKTFLDREQIQNKEPLLSKERDVIVDIHAYLGWHIQRRAERGESAGKISRTDLRRVVTNQLADRKKDREFATQLLNALQSRVLCLIEREPGAFQFEVASLREYFAAHYIFENAPTRGTGNTRDDCLSAVLERPVWLNVCRFFAGMLSKTEVKALLASIRELGSKPDLALHPHLRIVAGRLLTDRTYQGQSDTIIGEVVTFILDGPGVVLADDGFLDDSGEALNFSEEAGREQAIAHLRKRLCTADLREGARKAIVNMLGRHQGHNETAAWWWTRYEPTLAWLRTAAELGCLVSVTGKRVANLIGACCALTGKDTTVTELLIAGGYQGTNNDILSLCKREIAGGAASLVADSPTSPVGRLIAAARTAQRTGNTSSGHADRSTRRTRFRAKSGRSVLAHTVTGATSAGQPPSSTMPADWATWFKQLWATWGDSWVTRQAIAVVPASVDLVEVSRALGDPASRLRTVIRAEGDARSSRSDAAWWNGHLAAAETELDRRCALFSVLTIANTTVVMARARQITALTEALSPAEYRIVEASVRGFAHRAVAHVLNIHEVLRKSPNAFSAKALWLMRPLANEAGAAEIDRRLASTYTALLGPGMGDRRDVVRIAGATKTIKIEDLRGCRESLPPGAWASDIKLGRVSAATAAAILKNPDEWPTDIVARAIQSCAGPLGKLPPIDDLADSDAWFATP